MSIKKIAVLGAGAMGGGIAQVAAQSGFDVVLSDVDSKFVDGAIKRMTKGYDKNIEKGKMTADDKNAILGRIKTSVGYADFADADLAIEVIIEDLETKKAAFRELDSVCKPEAILATNTSSMSITVLANETKRPEKVVGMHFFNPPTVMRLVEVIRGYYTSDATVQVATDVSKTMGKTTIEVKVDYPGFVVNRLMLIQYMEAIRLVEAGVATPQDIDVALKLGLNHPMGQFELHDFAGTDIGFHVFNYLYNEHKDPLWNPPASLKAIIRAGRYGRKTGSGWYDYNK
jgi:3-hydroxybutyryl-CoA dehydrogenase